MSTIGSRIKALRLEHSLTQAELAKRVEMSYIQIGRYEMQKSNPSSDVLKKLAEALDTTTDFLMNGSTVAQATEQLTNKELLKQFKAVERLADEDRKMIITMIDALVTKRQLQKITS